MVNALSFLELQCLHFLLGRRLHVSLHFGNSSGLPNFSLSLYPRQRARCGHKKRMRWFLLFCILVGKTSGVERLEALRVLAEAWALNESVVERHHHEGRVKRCPTLKPFVSQKRPPEKKKQVLAWVMSIAKADDRTKFLGSTLTLRRRRRLRRC